MKEYCEGCNQIVSPKKGGCPHCQSTELTDLRQGNETCRYVAGLIKRQRICIVCVLAAFLISYPITAFAVQFAGIIGWVFIGLIIACFVMRSKIKRAVNAFNEFGNYELLYQQALQNPAFDHPDLLVGNGYTFRKKAHYDFVKNDEVLCVFRFINRAYGIKNFEMVKLVNQYGEIVPMRVKMMKDQQAAELFEKMIPLYPNARFGYTEENKFYVQTHKIDKPEQPAVK